MILLSFAIEIWDVEIQRLMIQPDKTIYQKHIFVFFVGLCLLKRNMYPSIIHTQGVSIGFDNKGDKNILNKIKYFIIVVKNVSAINQQQWLWIL